MSNRFVKPPEYRSDGGATGGGGVGDYYLDRAAAGGSGPPGPNTSHSLQELEHRARTASKETSSRLHNARRVAAETEAVGEATLEELGRQGEVVRSAHEQLQKADASLTRSEKLAKRLGGWFDFSGWKPKKDKIKGPSAGKITSASKLASNRREHEEQRNELVSKQVAKPTVDPNAGYLDTNGAYALERAEQDEVIDDISRSVARLKSLSESMNTEIDNQSGKIDDLANDVEAASTRIKHTSKRISKLNGN